MHPRSYWKCAPPNWQSKPRKGKTGDTKTGDPTQERAQENLKEDVHTMWRKISSNWSRMTQGTDALRTVITKLSALIMLSLPKASLAYILICIWPRSCANEVSPIHTLQPRSAEDPLFSTRSILIWPFLKVVGKFWSKNYGAVHSYWPYSYWTTTTGPTQKACQQSQLW